MLQIKRQQFKKGVDKARVLIENGEALKQYNKMGGKTYDYIG